MSARMHLEAVSWNAAGHAGTEAAALNVTETQIEALFRNFDQRNLVAALREIRRHKQAPESSPTAAAEQRREAVALQEQWEAWLARREQLRSEIKRGTEALEQVRAELESLRNRLEDWTGYERICGRNPLPEYMQRLEAKERIEQFLPGWLQRRQTELRAVTSELELCARQNGLEHLL